MVNVVDMSNIVKLRRSGNSAIVTVTREILNELDWKIGDNIEILIKDDGSKYLEVRKVKYVPV